jgi:serine protease Do
MDEVNGKSAWTRRKKILASLSVVLTLAVGILIGSVVSGKVSAMKTLSTFAGTSAKPLGVPDPIPAASSFSSIVTRVEPAVVNIATTQVLERKPSTRKRRAPQQGQGQGQGDGDDPMQDFFDRFFDGRQDAPPQAERSLGSGVIIDKRGYILTNNHVVEQATKVQVQLDGDTSKYVAKVIGVDEDTDLAVIKIDAGKELPTAKLGNSDGVQVGDWVLAIGSPFGLNATVTAGIISAKDRSGIGGAGHQFQRFIQTDAAINPGNSGGALIDAQGRVIGVTSSIASLGAASSGQSGNIGLGFAIPSSEAKDVADQLIQTGNVKHALLGVTLKDGTVSVDGAQRQAAVISTVSSGGAAGSAGVKAGDSVIALNGTTIDGSESLVAQIRALRPGTKVSLTVVRDGKAQNIQVTLGTRPADNG